MICDTLGYKEGVPFTLSFGFLAFSLCFTYNEILHAVFYSRAVSVKEWVVGKHAVIKEDTEQTTMYKCCPHIIFSSTSLIYEAIRKGLC